MFGDGDSVANVDARATAKGAPSNG